MTRVILGLAAAGLAVISGFAHAGTTPDCLNLPAPDPFSNFFRNFLAPCYALPLIQTDGRRRASDLEATYDQLHYRLDPGYEIVLVGEFPNARYLSLTVYDDHKAIADWLRDDQLIPATGSAPNPFQPGGSFSEDRIYVATVDLGGTQPLLESIAPGCGLGGVNLHANRLDATARHQGMSWNQTPGIPTWVPPHADAVPSEAGFLTVRRYLQAEDEGLIQLSTPLVIVRDLSNGCAVPAIEAVERGIVTYNVEQGHAWLDPVQTDYHVWYENAFLATMCHAVDPDNRLFWFRHGEYIRGDNADAGYLRAMVHPTVVSSLVQNDLFMRLRFKMPRVPADCIVCPPDPAADLRYWSLSFNDNVLSTLETIHDRELAIDPDGYVTLLVGFGATPPAHVAAENSYTFLDLSAVEGFENLRSLNIRNLLMRADFPCRISEVPYHTGVHHGSGGYLGEYVPLVDFVNAAQIPAQAIPLVRLDSCGVPPPESSGVCFP